jgi:pimeloyl-ACP methyl ester carboxylesterase
VGGVSRHVVLNGVRLHYLEWTGPPSSPCVVFLHGMGLSARTWDETCRRISPVARCVALDLRGYGDSEWSPALDYSPADYREDIAEFVQLLKVRQPVLVGNSLGATLALDYAISHNDKLSALILADVSPTPGDGAGAERIRRFIARGQQLDTFDAFVQHALEFNPRRDPSVLRQTLPNNLRRLPDGTYTWKYDTRHRSGPVADIFAKLWREHRAEVWSHAHDVRCPTLLLRGAQSEITKRADIEEFANALDGWRFAEIPDAGHTVQGDNPRSFAATMLDYLWKVRVLTGTRDRSTSEDGPR